MFTIAFIRVNLIELQSSIYRPRREAKAYGHPCKYLWHSNDACKKGNVLPRRISGRMREKIGEVEVSGKLRSFFQV